MENKDEFNKSIALKISQIIKAAADYQNNPDKAKKYIEDSIHTIVYVSWELGKISVVNELVGK